MLGALEPLETRGDADNSASTLIFHHILVSPERRMSSQASLASTPLRPSAGSAQSSSRVAAASGCLRVLVAEDDQVSRVRLVRTIQRLGHEVLVAADGVEAWEVFAERGADVVVTDWLMPGLDGPELCRRVRADSSAPYTYVIFSTALE